ncbi:MAG: methionine-gamma-lyase [Bacteroidota bacterium]|nr:methionine-gamma-lyase [Bacteroidota bacterium]
MKQDPADRVQDLLVFGEFGGVNPSIEESSTFTFLASEKMQEVFEHELEGCFLYSRHLNPTNDYLARAMAAIEGTEAGMVTASGMGAIACTLLQLCQSGDEIISSRTIYGGSYALLKNFFPRLGIKTHFVNITNLDAVASKINSNTKVIYTETFSNPLLEVADIEALRSLADRHNLKLVVDNTFTPMMITPSNLGAYATVYSLTKFANGTSDCVAGAICGTKEFIGSLRDVKCGAAMLLGPTLDSSRSASILKNLHTLNIRMIQHGKNAAYIADKLSKMGIRVFYPGLPEHPGHNLAKRIINDNYGFGGMLTFDAGSAEKANKLMVRMQENLVGYFAVSLGYFKTLFSAPGLSTSSEIPKEEQDEMGLTDSLVRMSVGLDADIGRTFNRIMKSMEEADLI